MKKGATFVFSLPMPDVFTLKDAEDVGGGHWRITNDPFGLRNGAIFRAFETEEVIRNTFSTYFEDLAIGSCDENYWGIRLRIWIVACKRR